MLLELSHRAAAPRVQTALREQPLRREEPGTRHREVPTVANGHVELRGDSYVV